MNIGKESRSRRIENEAEILPSLDRDRQRELLVICHSYKNFQKDPTEVLAPQFSTVNALVRTNPIAELGRFLPLPQLEGFSSAFKIDLNDTPDNIRVFPTPLWYTPTDRGYKKLGDKHLASVETLIKKHGLRFDLIHAHFTWSSGYVGARLKERYGVPLIVTAHGRDIYSVPFKDATWRRNIEYVLNSADAIITVSQSNLAHIKRLDVRTPVHVIPNGYRSALFYPMDMAECRRALGLPQDCKILLAVGGLEPVKGHRYLVEAIEEIRQKRKDIFCVIVGSGGEKRALEKQIKSLGAERNILLVGGKPHVEIPLWINACDLFVLPSLNEGNPTVMFEALGCGKPFIGTKVGGVPEIIISEEYGLLVEPADSSDLAENLLAGLDRDWDRNEVVRYAEQFTWENIAKRIMDVFSNVLVTPE